MNTLLTSSIIVPKLKASPPSGGERRNQSRIGLLLLVNKILYPAFVHYASSLRRLPTGRHSSSFYSIFGYYLLLAKLFIG